MNARTSRLNRLLELRRHDESLARQEFGGALRLEEEARQDEDRARETLEFQNTRLRDATTGAVALGVETWKALLTRVLDHERRVFGFSEIRNERTEARVDCERRWQDLRRKERALEKLVERRAEERRRADLRAEQKELDEVALRRHADDAFPRDASDEGVER